MAPICPQTQRVATCQTRSPPSKFVVRPEWIVVKNRRTSFKISTFLSGRRSIPHSPESNYSHEGRRRRMVYQRSDVGDSETHRVKDRRREGEEQNEMTSGKKLDCALRRDDGRTRTGSAVGHTKPKHTRIDVERRDVRWDDYGKIWENVVGTSAPSPSLRSAILIPHVRWVNGPEILSRHTWNGSTGGGCIHRMRGTPYHWLAGMHYVQVCALCSGRR